MKDFKDKVAVVRGNVQAKFPRVVDEQQKRALRGYAREETN